jgi:hypothetical protein
LFEKIGVRHRSFVEFGAGDGLHLSNTANLRLHHGWSGLLMESSERAENIEALLRRYDVPADFDLLSIDIDGNDYWVWKAIEAYLPRVVIVEYNIFFLPEMAKSVAYDADYDWNEKWYHRYHGASLAAFERLGRSKGYSLVYTEPYCPNAIFVRDVDLPAGVELPSLTDWTRWTWAEESYAEPEPRPGGRWVDV